MFHARSERRVGGVLIIHPWAASAVDTCGYSLHVDNNRFGSFLGTPFATPSARSKAKGERDVNKP